MRVGEILSHPFCYLYVVLYRLREKLFGYEIEYQYLPKDIDRDFIPIFMDPVWMRHGFLGRNKCLVPKGHPYSERFNELNPWFQSWVGTYYLGSFVNPKYNSEIKKVRFLSNAAIEDQNYWLISYGVPHPNSHLIKDSIKKVGERKLGEFIQKIYYGEIESSVDDSKYNNFDMTFAHISSVQIASIYNKRHIKPQLLLKDNHPSEANKVRLFGYFSVVEITKRKYLLTYVCGTKENSEKINQELLKVIKNISIRKL